jgi:hypothetical protein
VAGKRQTRDWQKIDPHLRHHPWFGRLVRKLDTDPIVAHGLLAGLWAFAFDFAQDSYIGKYSAADLAEAVGWQGDADQMMAALMHAGYIDDKMCLHHWSEWGGALFADRTADAHRKWDNRHSEQEVMSTDNAGQCRTMPQRRVEKKRREKSNPPTPLAGGNGDTPQLFADFWNAYPRKIDKQTALRAWTARVKAGEDPVAMTTAAQHYAEHCQREYTEPRYIKHASTFLGPDRPFLDWVTAPAEGCTLPEGWGTHDDT